MALEVNGPGAFNCPTKEGVSTLRLRLTDTSPRLPGISDQLTTWLPSFIGGSTLVVDVISCNKGQQGINDEGLYGHTSRFCCSGGYPKFSSASWRWSKDPSLTGSSSSYSLFTPPTPSSPHHEWAPFCTSSRRRSSTSCHGTDRDVRT